MGKQIDLGRKQKFKVKHPLESRIIEESKEQVKSWELDEESLAFTK